MNASVRTDSGIALVEAPIPIPGPTEILVKVRASSLNRADLSLVDGQAHGSHGGTGTVLGLEWSGDVVAVGEQVKTYKPGDAVMCSGIGGFAEYAVTDWRRAFPLPLASIGYEQGACLPISLRTTHTALLAVGQLQEGQSVLVLGASSAVGLMSLQLARLRGAGLVIGTSTQAQRRTQLPGFGADLALDSRESHWVTRVHEATAGLGVDLLIDFLAGPYINDSMRAVRLGGRIVNVGRMAGESGHFDFDLHSLRRIQYLGTTFRTRSIEEVGAIAERIQAELWPDVLAGRLGVPIDCRMPLKQVAEACEMMRSNRHFGKIVLTQTG